MKLQRILSILLLLTINVFSLIGYGEANVNAADKVKDDTAVMSVESLSK